jgi:hypothetical protein
MIYPNGMSKSRWDNVYRMASPELKLRMDKDLVAANPGASPEFGPSPRSNEEIAEMLRKMGLDKGNIEAFNSIFGGII